MADVEDIAVHFSNVTLVLDACLVVLTEKR
jgi:hypothetical protein